MGSLGQKNKLQGAKIYQSLSIKDRNELIEKYIGLVKKVALHVKARLPPLVALDDLVQSGMIGLIDAINNYKKDNKASFETYAMIRIRGSIIDHMRMYDWTPRTVHQNSRAINEAYAKVSQKLGRAPTSNEMAEALNVDVIRYKQMLGEHAQSSIKLMSETAMTDEVIAELPSIDLLTGETDICSNKIYDTIAYEELRSDLARTIASLNKREQQVISLYYEQEMNLREIGAILNLSESRACQLLASAVSNLEETMSIIWRDKKIDPKQVLGASYFHPQHRTPENFTAKGALPVKKEKTTYLTNLFDDVEEEESTPKYMFERQKNESVPEGLKYDVIDFFKSTKDARFADTLTQKFLNKTLDLPDATAELTLEDGVNLGLPFHVHSSRPRLKFNNLNGARMQAKKW